MIYDEKQDFLSLVNIFHVIQLNIASSKHPPSYRPLVYPPHTSLPPYRTSTHIPSLFSGKRFSNDVVDGWQHGPLLQHLCTAAYLVISSTPLSASLSLFSDRQFSAVMIVNRHPSHLFNTSTPLHSLFSGRQCMGQHDTTCWPCHHTGMTRLSDVRVVFGPTCRHGVPARHDMIVTMRSRRSPGRSP